MWQKRNHRLLPFTGLALALFLAFASPVVAQVSDPVEDLRLTLPMRLEDIANPTPFVLQFRQEMLQKKVDALRTIPQLRRALALDEWKEDPTRVTNEKLRLIDSSMRKQVGERLTKGIREVVASGDSNSKLAVANLIAEMGPTLRAMEPLVRTGYARSLTPEVIQLAQEKDLAVRQEALRALGNLNARVKDVMPVFKGVLEKDSLGPRRLAADGLAQLVRVSNHLQKRGRSGVDTTREEVLETVQAVLENSLLGLKDEDVQVRALSLIAFQTAAQALADQIPDGFNRKEFPPEGRTLSEEEPQNHFLSPGSGAKGNARPASGPPDDSHAGVATGVFLARWPLAGQTFGHPGAGKRRQCSNAFAATGPERTERVRGKRRCEQGSASVSR